MNNYKTHEVEFVIESDIKAKARPRATVMNGHAIIYTPKDTIYYENYVKACYKEQAENKYFADQPLEVSIEFYFASNQEIAKLCEDTKVTPERIHCQNHKDLDNLAKVILDGLNGVAFQDDKNITKLNLEKKYSNSGKEFVKVKIRKAAGISLDELKEIKKRQIIEKRIINLECKSKRSKADQEKLEKYKNELRQLKGFKVESKVLCCNLCKHHRRICINDSMDYMCCFNFEGYNNNNNTCKHYEKYE